MSGSIQTAVAGGMESMTNAPYPLPKARGGMRLGHGEVKDHMFLDGLEDAYEGRLMGSFAEDTARHYLFTREAQDAYAIESLARARRATERSEEHTSELQSLMRNSYADLCLKNKKKSRTTN